MANLNLYIGTYCPFCRKVENFIEDNDISGVNYINIDKDKEAREHLVEVGGKKQVPCLFVDEKPMYESMDIINYLKENYL